ncbi:MAG: hypothetical protein R3D29_16015 [Nitratireductor sp.]
MASNGLAPLNLRGNDFQAFVKDQSTASRCSKEISDQVIFHRTGRRAGLSGRGFMETDQ